MKIKQLIFLWFYAILVKTIQYWSVQNLSCGNFNHFIIHKSTERKKKKKLYALGKQTNKQTDKQNNLQFVTCPIAILLFNFWFYLIFEQSQNSFLGFIYFFFVLFIFLLFFQWAKIVLKRNFWILVWRWLSLVLS